MSITTYGRATTYQIESAVGPDKILETSISLIRRPSVHAEIEPKSMNLSPLESPPQSGEESEDQRVVLPPEVPESGRPTRLREKKKPCFGECCQTEVTTENNPQF
ncbi:hypothetical protein FQR65_LT03500 [Abscondita terminalis]|nr:hypothetical protein FQR65_LT03500 [Abscondita terminalis]